MKQHHKLYILSKFQLFMSILAKIKDQILQAGGGGSYISPPELGYWKHYTCRK